MKTKFCILILTIILTLPFYCSCKDDKEEVLIWNEPPSSADTLYQNPLFEPDLADPTAIRANDGWFYAYGTENTWSPGINRLIPIVRSKNMVKWEYVADAFITKPTWKSSGGGLWAPCIVFRNGKYYLYYSMSNWGDSNPGIGVGSADYPYGPFTDLGKVFDSSSIGVANSIDPFFMETGVGRNLKRYLFWGSFQGIYGIEMADDMKTTVGQKFKIAGNAFEAAYIYPKDGKFYFFGSVGSCCEGKDSKYHVTVAVADNIKGPYKTKTGAEVINNGQEGTPFLYGDQQSGWVGPGHNGEIFTDNDGREFIIYHAIAYSNPLLPNGATRRPLMMDEIFWNDGWPSIPGGFPSSTQKRTPNFKTAQ